MSLRPHLLGACIGGMFWMPIIAMATGDMWPWVVLSWLGAAASWLIVFNDEEG